MGITASYTVSQSGLRATSSWSDLTSDNIANANIDGYTRKEVMLSTSASGRVEVVGVRREVNMALDRMYRRELSRQATQQAISDGLRAHATHLGQPSDPSNLSSRLSSLQNSFDLLANNPSDSALQRSVLEESESFVRGINLAADSLEQARGDTARRVLEDVRTMDDALRRISQLNQEILITPANTAESTGLQDEIGRRLDEVSELMEVQIRFEGNGTVSVYATGGAQLVDGATRIPLRYDTVAGRLYAGNTDITPGDPGLRGSDEGRLAGAFTLLNRYLPAMNRQIDELARAMIVGFTDADASLAAGVPGLFTDGGNAYDPTKRDGLASRLSINDAVYPEKGGYLWRMRDGMGATTQGRQGETAQINAFISVMETPRDFDPLVGQGDRTDMTDFTAGIISDQQVRRSVADERALASSLSAQAIGASRLDGQGVNIDDELQQLMLIEQAYAANATMMKTLNEMMDTLLRAV
ncbi:flagellar hook-associated protein FlgK [Brevirhabdus pacifica]|uniref:Flagellar hook-associated protein 1 n=1 Tax=Brevirhabdus pacifica TaxID=1267768 RepID=A0A1U7DGT2_9RHOB|nr:flagellar hook-associated protein FlgK [Brevirhabdus pacifica]APX89210.1 flagellar hook-associated protein FlgK [Brevirhabdus pacifica]OWU76743.1 hypothetical protein ATO5_10945 [Loktanella sp. 22II-4b]PJJ86187.1 flagellar hook-associated protein 1 FlgK [Brevirhabdus pacifica]